METSRKIDVFKIENFLYKATQIGIASVLFLPLVLLGYFEITPYDQSSKALIFQSIIEIVFLLYAYLVLLNKNYLPRKSILLFVIVLFFFSELAAGFFGINFYRSFFGNLNRVDGIVLHLHLLAFFIVLVSIFREKKDWMRLFKLSVIVSAVSSVAALLQQFGFARFYNENFSRVSGTLVNSGMFGNYLALSIFLTIFVILIEKNNKLKTFWSLLLALNCWVLFFSGTRGAWAGVAAGVFLILTLRIFDIWRSRGFSKKNIVFALLFFLVILFAAFASFKIVEFYRDKNYLVGRMYTFSTLSIDSVRKAMWQTSAAAFLERPILGWGGDSFSFVWDKYSKGSNFENEYEMEVDKPHNKILEIAVSNGIIGLLAWLLGFFIIFYLIFKNKKHLALTGFFMCYFTVNFFLFDTISTYILFFLAAGFVNNNFVNAPDARLFHDNRGKISRIKIAFALVLAIFAGVIFYNLNIKTALAGMYFASGDASGAKEPRGALYGYSRSLSINTFYDYDFKMMVLGGLNSILETDPPDEIKKAVFDEFYKIKPSLHKYMETDDQQKRRLYLYITQMHKWLYLFNKDPKNLDEMQNIIQKGITLNQNFPLPYLDMARMKIFQNRYQEAVKYAENFYKLTPQKPVDEEKMHLALAQSYFEIDDFKNGLLSAEKVLEIDYALKNKGARGLNLPNFTNSVALTYYKIGEVQKALKIYQRAVEIYPNNAGLWQKGLEEIAKGYKK